MQAATIYQACTTLLGGLLLVLPGMLLADFPPGARDQQRELFRQLYADIKDQNLDQVRTRLPEVKSYPLYPWLEYEFLLDNFDKTPDQTLQSFTAHYPNSVMSDDIYSRWAGRLADLHDWSTLLRSIPDNPDLIATRCYRAEAMLVLGQEEEGISAGKAIWQAASRELPSDCDGLIRQLQKHAVLNDADYWQRIAALIANNHTSAARSLAQYLSADDAELVQLWTEIRKNPEAKLPDAFKLTDSARVREVIVFGLQRAADNKLKTALALWETAHQSFRFTPAEQGAVESRLGMWEAWRHDTDGLKRLKAIPAEFRSKEGNIWLARMAMRTGEWQPLLEASSRLLEQMEADESDRDVWQYWQARALEQIGKQAEATTAYRQLADNATFYGFLAADRLGQAYAQLDKSPPDRKQRIAGLRKTAAIQRWEEWMALGERSQARKEWFRALQAMDKEGMLAAAELATRQGDANLAIWTVSRTRDWNSVDLRFPLMYEQIVMEQARSQGIRPEWILGIMRRESAFDAGAESGANALGLMQLMPATARDVGKQLGMKVSGKEDILQPATNVQLGSAYLRSMLRRFAGNYAQATAAYNAGPGRVPKWAPDKTLQADQWVESIPFNETRDYVRAVMAYTTIYDHKLNQDKSTRLSVRLAPIKPE